MLVTWAEIADIAANVTDTPRKSKKGIPTSWQPPASGGTTEARRGGRKEEAKLKHGGSGVGIRGMQERLRQFEGTTTVEPNGSGVCVVANIPIGKKEQ